MNGKHYVGRDVRSLEHYDKVGPITGVSILVDEDNEYVAGDMTGYVFETTCPYGTQAMANAMLASLRGKVYNGFRATDAILDIDAELGDVITIDGEYSMLAYQEITFGPKHTSEIAAPGESILEHEYPYVGSTQRTINRKIAQVNSKIAKTAEEIRLEVANELDGMSSSIGVKLDSITSTVNGIDGKVSSINQKVESIELSVSNGKDSSIISLMVDGLKLSSKTIKFSGNVVFESDLANGTTSINGSCIDTGLIKANFIKLGGKMEVFQTTSGSTCGGYLGYVTSYDYEGNRTKGMGMMVPNEDYQVVVTDSGARLTSPNAEIVAGYHITMKTRNNVNMTAVGAFINNSEIATSSDRNKKENIIYGVEDYLPLFDKLRPCSFRYIGRNRQHLGMIAQDVEASLAELGIDTVNFAPLINNDGEYSLRYGEFIPLLIAKVQQIESRLEALSA